ncbi:MAG: LytTR family DNA-binding domain-containing protein [Bacteroidales bacterium]|jgi:DNA-binding LytR/AlgR family response regulator|nr:LytTR family DNA-binding domain-containing protein [Bacteroidales bacterium]
MKVVIIEDEALAAERLERMLNELVPDIVIAAKLTSIELSVIWLKGNCVDLIFLDIQLTDGLSFSIFDRVEVKTPIIFTTAYDQYAIKAFELNSISYLLKPIKKQSLENSLQKYQSLKSAYSINFENLLSNLKGETGYKKRFLVQIADKYKKVETERIAYFFAFEKNVFFRTTEGQTYPLDMTLDQVEKVIDPALFFRINRKYIVNINAISNMISWAKRRIKVELAPVVDDNTDTIVSMERYSEFKKWLDK